MLTALALIVTIAAVPEWLVLGCGVFLFVGGVAIVAGGRHHADKR